MDIPKINFFLFFTICNYCLSFLTIILYRNFKNKKKDATLSCILPRGTGIPTTENDNKKGILIQAPLLASILSSTKITSFRERTLAKATQSFYNI